MKKPSQFDSHHRLFWAVALASAGYAGLPENLSAGMRLVLAWNIFAAIDILLLWLVIVNERPKDVARMVTLQDSGRTIIFTLVVTAAGVSLGSVAFLLGGLRSYSGEVMIGHVILTIITIVLTWLMVHAVFALRYAHFYYRPQARGAEGINHAGGLEFPDESEPDYFDFIYFSLVIGMTCQVSDVQITSRKIRRLAMIHGVLSFAFNTIVLALTINILSGLLL